MENNNFPEPVGVEVQEPIHFPRKEELCRRLDEFHSSFGIGRGSKPSEMLRGALHATRKEYRKNNPDWMSQAANSIREIFYSIDGSLDSYFEDFGSIYPDGDFGASEVGYYKNFFEQITHHNFESAGTYSLIGGSDSDPVKVTPDKFLKAVRGIVGVLFKALRRQIDAYQEIKDISQKEPQKIDHKRLEGLMKLNFNIRDRFYEKIEAAWIDWLDNNNFFDVINEPASDPSRYSFQMPEINYLEKAIDEKPDKVTEIMWKIDPEENFNPEVVDRFIRITKQLSEDNLEKIVNKIHDENWVKLMKDFDQSSYVYQDLIEKLADEGRTDLFLKLADTVLTVREDLSKSSSQVFVLNHISQINLFEHLRDLAEQEPADTIDFAVDKINEVIGDDELEDDESLFDIEEPYSFLFSDFFEFKHETLEKSSHRADIQNFMRVAITVISQTIGDNCESEEGAQEQYQKIEDLPDTRTAWRLQLFALSLCPELFVDKLKYKFNRLFEVMDSDSKYYELLSDAEYRRALHKTFDYMDDQFKEDYVENVFSHFNPEDFDGSEKEKDILKDQAIKLLNAVKVYLDNAEDDYQSRSKEVFAASYKDEKIPDPQPAVISGEAKTIKDRSPVDLSNYDTIEIPDLLRNNLSPETLNEEYAGDPYDNPRNFEGVGNNLREDVADRINDYLEHPLEFFDPRKITSQYTYSFLQGVEGYLRDSNKISEKKWKNLFELLEKIEDEGLSGETPEDNTYLANWDAARTASARIMKYSLSEDIVSDELFGNSELRSRILDVISSLVAPKESESENAEAKSGDLFNIAINSTRGVACRAFVQFVCKDGEELSDDVQAVFENLVDNNESEPVWFVIGRNLPTIYFRKKCFVEGKLPQVFDTGDLTQFSAAWSGYVSYSLYEELFEKMEQYYKFVLRKEESEFPERQIQRSSLDGALGKHLSLAYTHFDDVSVQHAIFQTLFNQSDARKQNKFFTNIGRSVISGDLIPVDADLKEKMMRLWDYALNQELEAEAYSGFGFWINEEGGTFDKSKLVENVAKTLEKSNGLIDYSHNLKNRLKEFAKEDAQNTLTIMEEFLLNGVLENKQGMLMRVDDNLVDTFNILYDADKERTKKLINDLWEHENGGRPFWGLEEVIDEE